MGRYTHLIRHQNEMHRTYMWRCASPTHLEHTQALLLSVFKALVIFDKPFKSWYSTFETMIFSSNWSSAKTPTVAKGGHCEYHDLLDPILDGPGALRACVVKRPYSTHLIKTKQTLLRRENLWWPPGKGGVNSSMACSRRLV